MKETLPILFQDDAVVAVHKPSGLLVHRSMIDRHETRFALQIVRDQIGRHVYPVHRLDKGTSGVLLFALDAGTARQLRGGFDSGRVNKRYLAIVRGWMPERGTINHPLRRLDDSYAVVASKSGVAQNILRVNASTEKSALDAQLAVTHFRALAFAEIPIRVEPKQRFSTTRYSLVELNPITGRRHQLRRHLKHLSHPIIGDATYGKGIHNRFVAAQIGVSRLLLACLSMSIPHPAGGITLIEAPIAAEFLVAMSGMGWSEVEVLK